MYTLTPFTIKIFPTLTYHGQQGVVSSIMILPQEGGKDRLVTVRLKGKDGTALVHDLVLTQIFPIPIFLEIFYAVPRESYFYL